MIRIQPDLGRQIKGDAQTGLAMLEQIAVARVRFLRGTEAGILPHGPVASPVHVGLDAAGERVLARLFGHLVPARVRMVQVFLLH